MGFPAAHVGKDGAWRRWREFSAPGELQHRAPEADLAASPTGGGDFNSVCNSYQKQWVEDLLIFGFSLLYGGVWDHRNQKQSSLQRWSLPENWHDASLG